MGHLIQSVPAAWLLPFLPFLFIHSPPDPAFTVCQALDGLTSEPLRTNVGCLKTLYVLMCQKKDPTKGIALKGRPSFEICLFVGPLPSPSLYPTAYSFSPLYFFTLVLPMRHEFEEF